MEKPTDVNSTTNTFNRGVDSASGSIHKAIDTASDAASTSIKIMTTSAHQTVDTMASGAHPAADAVANKTTELRDLKQQLADNTRQQVRNHPLLTIGLAVAGGVLLSWWLGRHNGGQDAS